MKVDKIDIAIKDFGLMHSLIIKNLKAVFLNLRQLIMIFETLIEDANEKKVISAFF